jgi:DNA adenine methylase
MPPHRHYVEPFAGGLAVLLAKNPQGVSEVINDIDRGLTNFLRVVKDPDAFEHFRREVSLTNFSEAEWNDAALRLDDPDPARRAAAYFIYNRQSHAGRMDVFTPLSDRIRRGMNEHVSAWLSAVDGLPAFHDRLRNVVVLDSQCALQVIRQQDSPHTLFYCDPPYLHETRTAPDVYANEMSEEQHRALLAVLREVRGKVFLSGYRSRLYDEALAEWKRFEFETANHAAGGATKRVMTECVWANFKTGG